MLRVGLTGGIGAGKSTVAARLAEHGAVLIDADQIAREVVRPGTEALAEIAAAFGEDVLAGDGSLDRAALAAKAFADDESRQRLNAIVHPRIGARTAELIESAQSDAIVVHDIPLLVENGLAPAYHVVIVVDAPEDVRVRRLVDARGMVERDVRARIAAQASVAQRRAAADVWLDNSGQHDVVVAEVDALWADRLVPFESNLRLRKPRPPRSPVVVAADPAWREQAERACARLRLAAGAHAVRVDHIGSTSVPGLAAKDVIDVQVVVPTLTEADALEDALEDVLADAGFPRLPGQWWDEPHGAATARRWAKHVHVAADPARPINVHVRPVSTDAWRHALLFAAFLRAHDDEKAAYADLKLALAREHEADGSVDAYADDKANWVHSALDRAQRWAHRIGWTPDADQESVAG